MLCNRLLQSAMRFFYNLNYKRHSRVDLSVRQAGGNLKLYIGKIILALKIDLEIPAFAGMTSRKKECILLVVIFWLMYSCTTPKSPQYENFEAWKKTNVSGELKVCKPSIQTAVFTSDELSINGIAKSMSGDLSEEKVSVSNWADNLIWVKSAKVEFELKENPNLSKTSDEFICHAVLDLHQQDSLPWKIPTSGTFKRLFTFSQGATSIEFPEGFAMPILESTKLSFGSQVLNLNRTEFNDKARYTLNVEYFKQEPNCTPPKALYQQAVFVTKKTGGPAGAHNAPIFSDKEITFSSDAGVYMDTSFAKCGLRFDSGYNPYEDSFGRTFNGHWTVAKDSLEVLATNVTPMLNLQKDTRIHAIAMHVHPYAHSLTLVDKTTGEELYKGFAHYKNQEYSIIKKLDSYSSPVGIPVYKDHEYQLISTYLNPNRIEDITAMATLFLYLAE